MKKARDISKGPFWKLIEMELIGTSDRGCVLELHVKKRISMPMTGFTVGSWQA